MMNAQVQHCLPMNAPAQNAQPDHQQREEPKAVTICLFDPSKQGAPRGQSLTTSTLCKHSKQKHYKTNAIHTYCFDCGIRVRKGNMKAYKSEKMGYKVHTNPQHVYRSLFCIANNKVPQMIDTVYLEARKPVAKYMYEIGKRCRLSPKTLQLSIIFLDFYINNNPSKLSNGNLLSLVAIMLAAKTIEKEERIPFISDMGRISGLQIDPRYFKELELEICTAFDWHLQQSTLIEQLEFFFSQGIVFEADYVNDRPISPEYHKTQASKPLSRTALMKQTLTSQLIPVEAPTAGSPLQEVNLNAPERCNHRLVTAPDEDPLKRFRSEEKIPKKLQQLGAVNQNGQRHASKGLRQSFTFNGLDAPACVLAPEPSPRGPSMPKTLTGARAIMKGGNKLTEKGIVELLHTLEQKGTFLSDLIVIEPEYLQFNRQFWAPACVAFLRELFKITPVWNRELEELTTYKLEHLQSYISMIRNMHDTSFQPQGRETVSTPQHAAPAPVPAPLQPEAEQQVPPVTTPEVAPAAPALSQQISECEQITLPKQKGIANGGITVAAMITIEPPLHQADYVPLDAFSSPRNQPTTKAFCPAVIPHTLNSQPKLRERIPSLQTLDLNTVLNQACQQQQAQQPKPLSLKVTLAPDAGRKKGVPALNLLSAGALPKGQVLCENISPRMLTQIDLQRHATINLQNSFGGLGSIAQPNMKQNAVNDGHPFQVPTRMLSQNQNFFTGMGAAAHAGYKQVDTQALVSPIRTGQLTTALPNKPFYSFAAL